MTPDLISLIAIKSSGVAVGVFIGVLIGLSMRANKGNRSGLFRDSIYATAFLASMGAWAITILLRMIMV
ncbi:hypothetical protein EDD53_0551 [Pacificibacter maritimus]|uniref:Uncharacterized protein n=1 Tax=Pacificibacter maritimus TaxID=762213 RepID=A0A3N4ULV6_9RHOB|nr:hypothetical protein [Pacificibacter maritimus]RPE71433.1 hypothetical protein EDD53_0551 [Pacificibacter maritimus]